MAKREPVLATKTYRNGHDLVTVTAWGGLHSIKGNSKPYFSLTMGSWRNRREDTFGAAHDEILKHWPQFADLAALHLSDIDGAPMHAIANGWYNLAGSLPDALGARYHRGNSDMNFADGYRKPTGDECVQFFANHCRIPLSEAHAIRATVLRAALNSRSDRNAIARANLAEIMATMVTRWKQEADACIAKHGLVIYGDVDASCAA